MSGSPQSPSPAASGAAEVPNRGPGLFGRGLLYVVVFSAQTVIATVTSPVLAYLIGPAEFGRIAAAVAVVQMLVVLNVLGLDQAIVLQRSEDADDQSSRGLLAVSIVVAAAVSVVLLCTAHLWGPALGFGGLSTLLTATIVWTFAGGCTAVLLGLLLAEDRLKVLMLISGVAGVGGPIVGVVLVALGPADAGRYVLGAMVSQLVALGVGLVVVRPRPSGLCELSVTRRAFAIGAPVAVSGMAGFVLNAGDRIIIQRLLGPEQVGRYQVAYTVGYVVILLLMFTSQAWTPRFAAIREQAERRGLMERARNELYRMLIPVVLGVTLAAPVVLKVVAPASFDREPLTFVVFLIAISAFPVAAGGASGRELFTLRRGRGLAISGVVAAALNVVLNLVLVPKLGIAGSAVATTAALTAQAGFQLLAIPQRRTCWPRAPVLLWLGVLVSCMVGLATTQLPQTTGWNLARVGFGLACLPWFLSRLAAARTGITTTWREPFSWTARTKTNDPA